MSSRKFNKLAGARVLVLGGTSGIGFSVAEGSIEYGASVVIASSNAQKVEKAIARLRSAYPEQKDSVDGLVCDLYSVASMETNIVSLLAFATKDGKKIDHIVNTAGSFDQMPKLSELKPEQIQGMSVRHTALLMLAKLAPTYMEPGPQSSLSATTGTLLYKPIMDYVSGIAQGGAVEAAARGLAVALAPIRVNLVAPGAIDTEMLQGYGKGSQAGKDAIYNMFRETNLLKIIGRPEDTAEAYLYLMKDRFVTGQTILTDGGRLLL